MYHYGWGLWWLVFPIGFFVFRAFDSWLGYRASRDRLDLIKAFTNQGKDPPPELLGQEPDFDGGYRPRRWRRRYFGYAGFGRFWLWRGAIVTGAVAVGFWVASSEGLIPGTEGVFRFVAIILTCVAAANLAMALVSTLFRKK